jgi:pyruvate dehydrogenase E1 component beta subunit
MSYRDAVAKALQDSMRDEPRLIIIGQNLAGHALKQLAQTYGEARVRDTSISESAMVGMAVGATMRGWKAVVMIAYADIASVCHMAIVQSAAKLHYLTHGRLNCPVIIRLPIAVFAAMGRKGTRSAYRFYNVPDLNIAMPGSANEAYWNFREALQHPTPRYFRRSGRFIRGPVKSPTTVPGAKRRLRVVEIG